MSREELHDLVRDFRNTLAELVRKGCEVTSSGPCAPAIELAPIAAPPMAAEASREASASPGIGVTGSRDASLMFIAVVDSDGDAVRLAAPAQALLEKMIVAMGWQVAAVCIVSIQVPSSDPDDGQAARRVALAAQIESVAPAVIVSLGETATRLVLPATETSSNLRGSWHMQGDIPVMATYDPSWLLREPAKKREAWADLQEVMRRLESLGRGPGSSE